MIHVLVSGLSTSFLVPVELITCNQIRVSDSSALWFGSNADVTKKALLTGLHETLQPWRTSVVDWAYAEFLLGSTSKGNIQVCIFCSSKCRFSGIIISLVNWLQCVVLSRCNLSKYFGLRWTHQDHQTDPFLVYVWHSHPCSGGHSMV